MKELPLQVIIKELANTSWSLLPEGLLRELHSQLQNTITSTPTALKRLTIPKYVPTAVKGKASDLEVTYNWQDVGFFEPTIHIDEVFVNGDNITELLSEKAMKDIVYEAKAIVEKEAS